MFIVYLSKWDTFNSKSEYLLEMREGSACQNVWYIHGARVSDLNFDSKSQLFFCKKKIICNHEYYINIYYTFPSALMLESGQVRQLVVRQWCVLCLRSADEAGLVLGPPRLSQGQTHLWPTQYNFIERIVPALDIL